MRFSGTRWSRSGSFGACRDTASAAEFGADLDVLHRALISHKCGLLGRGRLRRLRHAVAIFGFHLAPLDLRQNSDVHARTVAELLAIARPGVDYQALDEDARVALLLDELATPRPLTGSNQVRLRFTSGSQGGRAPVVARPKL